MGIRTADLQGGKVYCAHLFLNEAADSTHQSWSSEVNESHGSNMGDCIFGNIYNHVFSSYLPQLVVLSWQNTILIWNNNSKQIEPMTSKVGRYIYCAQLLLNVVCFIHMYRVYIVYISYMLRE